jgi:hypothetical protein
MSFVGAYDSQFYNFNVSYDDVYNILLRDYTEDCIVQKENKLELLDNQEDYDYKIVYSFVNDGLNSYTETFVVNSRDFNTETLLNEVNQCFVEKYGRADSTVTRNQNSAAGDPDKKFIWNESGMRVTVSFYKSGSSSTNKDKIVIEIKKV